MAASQYFDQVQQLYIAYFGRPADPVGLSFWAANIDAAGGNISGVISGFSASNESQALYAAGSTAQLVTSIYMALFNRPPETAGLVYWVSLIDSKTVSGAAAAYQILTSAGPGDATSIANKLTAASAFTAQLDTPAEITGYGGTNAASYGRAYLSGVDATAVTLNNAINSQTLANTVAVATNTLVTSTPAAPSVQTTTLTTGADTLNGTDGNDSFVGTLAGAFGKGDLINGGNGTDTLTVTDPGNISSSGVTVSNVENASFTAGGNLTLDTTSWTGLQSLTAQSTALGAGAINVNGGVNVTVKASNSTTGTLTVGATTAPSGEINATNSSTGAVSMGSISVTGGTKVTVNQQTTNALNTTTTLGTVSVTGTAQTTSVTVNNAASAVQSVTTAGVTTNQVIVEDKNNGSSILAGSITDVSVSNYTGVTVRDNALKNLTLVNGSSNIIIQNGVLPANTNTTLNLKVNGLTGGALSDAGVYTTLNLTSTGSDSQLTSTTGMTALKAVTISGTAGFAANLSGATVNSVDASGTSGNVTVTIDATSASYTGGSGVNKVTLADTDTPNQILTGGAGTGDVLTMDAGYASILSNANLISGFEQIVFSNTVSQIINTANFAGATTFFVQGLGLGLTLNNLVSGNTIVLTGSGYAYSLNGNFTGSSDALKIQLSPQNNGVGFANGGITASGVEIVQITTVDARLPASGNFNNRVTWLGDDVQTITVSGNAGLALTATSTALTSVDASGITLPPNPFGNIPTNNSFWGGFTWTAGAASGLTTVKGSATGNNIVDLSAATHVASYTGGSGKDTITIGAVSAAIDINSGSGYDTLKLSAAGSTSNGYARVSSFSAGDKIDFSAAGVTGGAANTAQATLGAAVTLAGGSTLTDYLNAAASSVTANTTTALTWFQYSGNTYVVLDASSSNSFVIGSDSVVQLNGQLNLTNASIANNVVTLL